MKRLFLLTFVLILLFFSSYRPTNAESTGLQLVVINYETRDELDVLFAHSTRPLFYLDGKEVEKPTFIGLYSGGDRSMLTTNGVRVKIIDMNADLDNYVLLWHREKNKSSLLADLGDVIVISPYYTLLKTPPGKPFTHTGKSSQFFDIPFMPMMTPFLREKTVEVVQSPTPLPEPTPLPTALPEAATQNYASTGINYIFIAMVFLTLLAAIAGGVFYYFKKRNSETLPPQDNTPPMNGPQV